MTFPRPRKVWQWLLLISPAAVMILCGIVIPSWIVGARERSLGTTLMINTYGIWVSVALSLGLGYWWSRGEKSFLRRAIRAFGLGILIEFVNVLVAFPGCIVLGAIGAALAR